MKKLLLAAAALGLLCAVPAQAAEVTAGKDSNCNDTRGNFVVPAGSVAKNFAISNIDAGTECSTAGLGVAAQMVITTADLNKIYRYLSRGGTTWEEIGTRTIPHQGSEASELKTLVLGAGSYVVLCGGGKGARVVVTFDVVP